MPVKTWLLTTLGAIVPFVLSFIYLAVKPSIKDAALFIAFLTLCTIAFLPIVPYRLIGSVASSLGVMYSVAPFEKIVSFFVCNYYF